MGERTLQGLRADQELTQQMLANKLQMKLATYQRIEKDPSKTRISTAKEIADALGVSILDIKWKR